jgi:hypothetical protein
VSSILVSISVSRWRKTQRVSTDPPVHMYRHDLESMFYVLIWTTSRFHNRHEIPLPPLQEWVDNDGVTVMEKKSFFVMMTKPLLLTPQFDSFGRWIVSMQTMFRDGFYSTSAKLQKTFCPFGPFGGFSGCRQVSTSSPHHKS